MQRKIVLFVCAVLSIVLALSVVTAVRNRSELGMKENKVEPTVKHFIEVFNNVEDPEYKTMYWELLSKQTKDKLIQQTGSLEAAQASVWILLQEIVDSQRHVEFLGIEYTDIRGNIATVLIRVNVSEGGGEPEETTVLHKYRWENGEWKFIDWVIEPEAYQE
ncbi:MAG: hypothetical protein HXS48_23930 [Theionarchaea archaeon]|nr:hypothetical protein [Theionarchaea archaeon]